jgi:HEAT repeat protein
VVIRASSGRQVEPLIADLSSDSTVTRDGAVARLIVIGSRAVQRLIAVVAADDVRPDVRGAALHALEGIGDVRGYETASDAVDSADQNVAAAAIGVLHRLLQSSRGVEALDRLISVTVDQRRSRVVRLAAIRALSELQSATVQPLFEKLTCDPDSAIALAAGLGPGGTADPAATLREGAEGGLPDSPAPLRVALTEAAGRVPVEVLERLIERVRFREGAESGTARAEWMALRAAAHAAVADRGSRAALYDLRETFESARGPLPVEFLGAASRIGDAACLEAVAAAWAHAIESGVRLDDWWCQRLIDVFRAIAAREKITKRHAAGKRITSRWRDASSLLWP